jgi:ribosomal protein S18 acetylase RimI-like enzyme
MWPFSTKLDLNKIQIHLNFWGGEMNPTFTVRLSVDKHEVLEGVGCVQGSDFRLSNIVTVPAYRDKGLATTVVGTLIGAARARQCSTFTFEDVSPRNLEAIDMYQRFGAVALPPNDAGGHADYQIRL